MMNNRKRTDWIVIPNRKHTGEADRIDRVNRKREIKGKQIWTENKIQQKRTQKRTEGTEKKVF